MKMPFGIEVENYDRIGEGPQYVYPNVEHHVDNGQVIETKTEVEWRPADLVEFVRDVIRDAENPLTLHSHPAFLSGSAGFHIHYSHHSVTELMNTSPFNPHQFVPNLTSRDMRVTNTVQPSYSFYKRLAKNVRPFLFFFENSPQGTDEENIRISRRKERQMRWCTLDVQDQDHYYDNMRNYYFLTANPVGGGTVEFRYNDVVKHPMQVLVYCYIVSLTTLGYDVPNSKYNRVSRLKQLKEPIENKEDMITIFDPDSFAKEEETREQHILKCARNFYEGSDIVFYNMFTEEFEPFYHIIHYVLEHDKELFCKYPGGDASRDDVVEWSNMLEEEYWNFNDLPKRCIRDQSGAFDSVINHLQEQFTPEEV